MTPMYVHINAGAHTHNDKYRNCTNTQNKLIKNNNGDNLW